MSQENASHTLSIPGLSRREDAVIDEDVPMDAPNDHGFQKPTIDHYASQNKANASQLDSTQDSNVRYPPPLYNAHFSLSDAETQYIDSQQDEAMDGTGSQKENTPLRHGDNWPLTVAEDVEGHDAASSSSSRGAYKGATDNSGPMPPPSFRAPFVPSTPPSAQSKPSRAVSFLSPYSGNPTRDVARSRTFPTHSSAARQRSASPPSLDPFGGTLHSEGSARNRERYISPSYKGAPPPLAASPESDIDSHWSSLYGPRSIAMVDKTSLTPPDPTRIKAPTNTYKAPASSPRKPRSPEPDATQSSSSSQVTRSQVEALTVKNNFGQGDTGPSKETLAAVFSQSQKRQLANSSIPGLDFAVDGEPTQPATPQPTQQATQLETQVDTQIDTQPATQLDPRPSVLQHPEDSFLEPTQLEDPIFGDNDSFTLPSTRLLAPGMAKPKPLTRRPKYIEVNASDDEPSVPGEHLQDAPRGSNRRPSDIGDCPDEVSGAETDVSAGQDPEARATRSSRAPSPALSSSPVVSTRLSRGAPLRRRHHTGPVLPLTPHANEGSAQKRKRAETTPNPGRQALSPPAAQVSPPKKRVRKGSDAGEVVPPSDSDGTHDDNIKRRPVASPKTIGVVTRRPVQPTRPQLSAGYVPETEDEYVGKHKEQQATESESEDDDVPLTKSKLAGKARTKVDLLKEEIHMPSSSPDVPLISTLASSHRRPTKAYRDESEDEEPMPFPRKSPSKLKGKQRAIMNDEETGDSSPYKPPATVKQPARATPNNGRAKGRQMVTGHSGERIISSPTTTHAAPEQATNGRKGSTSRVAKRAVTSRTTKPGRRYPSKSASASETPEVDMPEYDDDDGTEPATTELPEGESFPPNESDQEVESPGTLPSVRAGSSRIRSRKGTRSTMSSTSTLGILPRTAMRAPSGRSAKRPGIPTPSRSRTVDNIGPQIRVLAAWNSQYFPAQINCREGTQYKVSYDDGDIGLVGLAKLRRLELRTGDEVRWGKSKWERGTVHEFIDRPRIGEKHGYTLKVVHAQSNSILEPESVFHVSKAQIKTWDDRKLDPAELEVVRNYTAVAESPVTRANSKRMTEPDVDMDYFWSKAGFVITGNSTTLERERVVHLINERGGRIIEEWTDVFSQMGHFTTSNLWVATQDDLVFDGDQDYEHIYLLSDVPCRKPKYLMALALGVPCISFRWIEEQSHSNEPVSFAPYLLPAGTSKPSENGDSRLKGLSWGQLADLSWGQSPEDLVSIRDARCSYRPFKDQCVLIAGDDYVPSSDSHLACVPRIVLAMGARLVVAAKRSHAHKTSEIRDPKPDPNREFGHNTQFDLIILKNKDDLGQISIPLNSVHAKVEDWHWVTDCLIARNQF